MTLAHRILLLLVVTVMTCGASFAQVTRGTPPFGSYAGGPDAINLANLNAHFTVPVLNRAGRGLAFSFYLTYDTSIWYPVTSGGTTSWNAVTNWGWDASPVDIGSVTYQETFDGDGFTYEDSYFSNWVYIDGFGTPHPFAGTASYLCHFSDVGQGHWICNAHNLSAVSTDASGYSLSIIVPGQTQPGAGWP